MPGLYSHNQTLYGDRIELGCLNLCTGLLETTKLARPQKRCWFRVPGHKIHANLL